VKEGKPISRSAVLRRDILKKVEAFHKEESRPRPFIPGTSPVPYGGRVYDAEEMVRLVDASLDFWLTAGPCAEEFEGKLSQFLGLKHCLLVNSGSSANLLAMTALTSPKLGPRRLMPGDEVITQACGFPTTLNPILQNNLVPVFVDIDPGTYNVDPSRVEKAVRKKTKAIFLAHTLGNPAPMGPIMDIARRHGLWVIEDNCDALGALYRGRPTGTFGDLCTCSFYPAHHITLGEGGAVLTRDGLLKKIVMSLRDWGRDCWCVPGEDNTCRRRFSWQFGTLPKGFDHKYVYSHIGYNLKATDLQAAIGNAQMKKLPRFIRARQRNFAGLHRRLRRFSEHLVLPRATPESEPSWFGFPISVKPSSPFNRRQIVAHLEKHRIATRMLFAGNLLRHPAYEGIPHRTAGSLKHTDAATERVFWIGVYPGLTGEHLDYMAAVFGLLFDGGGRKG